MHEMRIAGDTVNLAANLLKILILIREILKLLRYLFKFIIYKTLYFKLTDFFSN